MKHFHLSPKVPLVDRLLLCVVPLAILLVLVLLLITHNTYRAHTRALVHDELHDNAVMHQRQIDDFLTEKKRTLRMLARMPEIYEMDRARQKAFLRDWLAVSGFHHIFLLDAAGQGYYPLEGDGVLRDQSQDPFAADCASHETLVTDSYGTDEGPITTVCVAVYRPDGQRVGTLCGAVSLKTIERIVNEGHSLFDGSCYILDQKGRYISVADNVPWSYEPLGSHPDTDASLIAAAADSDEEQSGESVLHGEKNYITVLPMDNAPWLVLECAPAKNVDVYVEKMGTLFLLLAVLASMLFFALLHVLISWRRRDEIILTDALTGCGSRIACEHMLRRLEHDRSHATSILYFDLNDFKTINDTQGHEMGDLVLRLFSRQLREAFEDIGFVGRLGGDEFIVIATDTPPEELHRICTAMRARLRQQSVRSLGRPLTFSYGCATRAAAAATTLSELLNEVDQAMYAAKEAYHQQHPASR